MSTVVKIPHHLKKEIQNQNCLLFLGSGASVSAGLPSGKDLVGKLAEELGNSQYYNTLAETAQAYSIEFGKNALLNSIMDVFMKRKQPGRTHQLIASIPYFSLIVTTNWDTLMEDALSVYPIVDETQYSVYYKSNARQVLKIHGCITRPETVIVTRDDYARFFQGGVNTLIWNEFRNLLATKTALYIGYGLEDPNFIFLIEQLRDSLGDLVRVGFAVQKNPAPTDIRNWTRKGIEIISSTGEEFLEDLTKVLD